MRRNKNLITAKVQDCDEFYTNRKDIESEILDHPEYIEFLKGKKVYLPCDDPAKSQFARFFFDHFCNFST